MKLLALPTESSRRRRRRRRRRCRRHRRRHLAAIGSEMRVTVCDYRRQYFAALCLIGCIFKGCHVKRQARPLNTFKFINGEGYTPAILYNTSRGKKHAYGRAWCSRYVILKALIRRCALRFTLYTPYDLQFALSLKRLDLFQIRHVIARRHAAHW